VLLVSQEYPPETAWGGIGTYVGTLAPALAAAGAEVHVLAVGGVDARADVERDRVQIHRAPAAGALPGRLSRLPETWRRASLAAGVARERRRLRLDFDILEAPDWGAEAAALRRPARGALVVRLHSSAAQVFPFTGGLGIDRRLAMRIEHSAIRRADLVTGTAAQLAHARESLSVDPTRLRELTYPVEPVTVAESEPSAEVLFLGRLEARKGPDTLIRALPGLRARVPGARLLLAGVDTGATSYRAELERLAAGLGVAEFVTFDAGWGAAAVQGHLGRARVVAVPSRWESFGYTAAEAMAAGRAVAASAIPAFRDLVEDGVNGILVEPEDPAGWSAALARLLLDPDGAGRLGAAARRHMSERHAPSTVATRTLELYEEAMARAAT
jgi:glycosyltransferase involved in cell wall biosynthesis